jgi:hypothetical protein
LIWAAPFNKSANFLRRGQLNKYRKMYIDLYTNMDIYLTPTPDAFYILPIAYNGLVTLADWVKLYVVLRNYLWFNQNV